MMPTLTQLPAAISDAVAPLFGSLPAEVALERLVVETPGDDGLVPVVRATLGKPPLRDHPQAAALAAALWLYIDRLDESHRHSQSLDTPTGAYWHAILHRREGDFSNAHYWLRKADHHPAMAQVGDGYHAKKLVDLTDAAFFRGDAPQELIDMQRREWAALFAWCANAQ